MRSRTSNLRGFTLIEIMVVVAILGIVLAIGMPAIYQWVHRESLTSEVKDIMEVCSHARAQAVLTGTTAEMRIDVQGKHFSIAGGAPVRRTETGHNTDPDGRGPSSLPVFKSSGAFTAQLSPDVTIELLDVNFGEYKDEDSAVVHFYPNGTSDEFTIVLRGDNNEWRKISLEVVTGLADVESIR